MTNRPDHTIFPKLGVDFRCINHTGYEHTKPADSSINPDDIALNRKFRVTPANRRLPTYHLCFIPFTLVAQQLTSVSNLTYRNVLAE